MTLYSKLKSSFFYGLKHQDIDLSTEKCDALQKLASNPTLIICKPGIRNEVVVMNKNDYINKILSSKMQFQKVSVDDNIENLTKFQQFLYNLKRKQFLKKKFTIELDPTQLLLLQFMVGLS